MNPPPKGWPRISSSLFYDDAATAIDWLCEAFGFETQLRIEGEGGRIEHSQLVLDGGLIMVSSAARAAEREFPLPGKSPQSADGTNTQTLAVFVDDVDAHCEHARAAGATIAQEPTTTDYGDDYWSDRSYRAVDPEGHHWWFMQRMRG
jgi:uncharacterized glyoxalase superfamily protein PhnB